MDAESGPIQERTIAGPFGEQIPEPQRTSPFAQPLEQQQGDDSLAGESSGALKPPALPAIKARIDAYGRWLALVWLKCPWPPHRPRRRCWSGHPQRSRRPCARRRWDWS